MTATWLNDDPTCPTGYVLYVCGRSLSSSAKHRKALTAGFLRLPRCSPSDLLREILMAFV